MTDLEEARQAVDLGADYSTGGVSLPAAVQLLDVGDVDRVEDMAGWEQATETDAHQFAQSRDG